MTIAVDIINVRISGLGWTGLKSRGGLQPTSARSDLDRDAVADVLDAGAVMRWRLR